MTLVNMIIWERSNSQPARRTNVPLAFAQSMAIRGGFHRVTITGECDQILSDWKHGLPLEALETVREWAASVTSENP